MSDIFILFFLFKAQHELRVQLARATSELEHARATVIAGEAGNAALLSEFTAKENNCESLSLSLP